jgi:cellulose synthase/poly-beta-1,6-N-acetylglucosamine synthase-like glycosyltransferase
MAEAYGSEKVEILILDDSDDDTVAVIDRLVEAYSEKGFRIEVLRRPNRQGYKAGALDVALRHTQEDFIAIFDADFVPPADFLVRAVPHFCRDESLGIVQSRWFHMNRDYNILTKAISIGIDVHFLFEQSGRYATGSFQNFNGSGGVIRRQALLEAGGWRDDTLTEDLDASYRIQMSGYKVLFLKDLLCPGEIPPTVPSFKKQQGRWANGSLRTAKIHLPKLLTNNQYGILKRLEAFIHLTGYFVHPLMFASFLLACLAALLRVNTFNIEIPTRAIMRSFSTGTIQAHIQTPPQMLIIFPIVALIFLCTIAAWIPPFMAIKLQNLRTSQIPSIFLLLMLLGFGISLSNTVEAGKALLTNRNFAFKRTPKYAVQHDLDEWRDKRYQVPLDLVSLLELFFVILGSISIGYSILDVNLGVLIILIPFTSAYIFVFFLTLLQSRPERAA